MNAQPLLRTLARVLHEHKLEAVLIGNAAAALNGAPVTTVDFDFLFRTTPANLRKLRGVARSLGATIWKPNYPASGFRCLLRDEDLLLANFMTMVTGVKSFSSPCRRAQKVDFDGSLLLFADLRDMINSRGRPRDQESLHALRVAADRAQLEQIRRLLRLRPEQRTSFCENGSEFRHHVFKLRNP